MSEFPTKDPALSARPSESSGKASTSRQQLPGRFLVYVFLVFCVGDFALAAWLTHVAGSTVFAVSSSSGLPRVQLSTTGTSLPGPSSQFSPAPVVPGGAPNVPPSGFPGGAPNVPPSGAANFPPNATRVISAGWMATARFVASLEMLEESPGLALDDRARFYLRGQLRSFSFGDYGTPAFSAQMLPRLYRVLGPSQRRFLDTADRVGLVEFTAMQLLSLSRGNEHLVNAILTIVSSPRIIPGCTTTQPPPWRRTSSSAQSQDPTATQADLPGAPPASRKDSSP